MNFQDNKQIGNTQNELFHPQIEQQGMIKSWFILLILFKFDRIQSLWNYPNSKLGKEKLIQNFILNGQRALGMLKLSLILR